MTDQEGISFASVGRAFRNLAAPVASTSPYKVHYQGELIAKGRDFTVGPARLRTVTRVDREDVGRHPAVAYVHDAHRRFHGGRSYNEHVGRARGYQELSLTGAFMDALVGGARRLGISRPQARPRTR